MEYIKLYVVFHKIKLKLMVRIVTLNEALNKVFDFFKDDIDVISVKADNDPMNEDVVNVSIGNVQKTFRRTRTVTETGEWSEMQNVGTPFK
ncbi:MAG: hypothetical protein WBI40_08355 [Methylococcaceae bacterium]